jgi:cation diffusion facilitator family transporter
VLHRAFGAGVCRNQNSARPSEENPRGRWSLSRGGGNDADQDNARAMRIAETLGASMNRTIKTAWGSLAISAVVLGLKLMAWWVTASVALYSDALETIINVIAACTALVALQISSRPADADHPYGHQKAEYFSAVLEGMMVIGAAAAILHEVYNVWSHPTPIAAPLLGIAINGVATVINGGWAAFLIRSGRAWRSPAILASGQHVLTDVWTSLGVAAGFALVPFTGWIWLDPAIAALVAVNIIWVGYAMVRDSVGSLMDKAVAPEVLDGIRRVIASRAEGALEAHDLRTRTSGQVTFIEFHLVLPARMDVEQAHGICDRLERALREEIGDAVITIHVEPEAKAKHQGIVVL